LTVAVTEIMSVAVTLDGAPVVGSPFAVAAGCFGPLLIDVAPGSHTVAASASAREHTYAATATVDLTFGGPNSVTLYLFDNREHQQFQTVPVVVLVGANPAALVVTSGLAPPTSCQTSKTVDLDASAVVSVLWTDSCGGTFSDSTATGPTYTPPGHLPSGHRVNGKRASGPVPGVRMPRAHLVAALR
jgi:hypothetical protein